MPKILSFKEALSISTQVKKAHLLLGNGFSRAWRNDIFSYNALFNCANFSKISREARRAFDALETTDFEVVMRALRDAAKLLGVYAKKNVILPRKLKKDADSLRSVLAETIANNHPAHPSEVTEVQYSACRKFLSNFERIYTLNYDLLLYWALMHEEAGPKIVTDDGFRKPESGDEEYVTWEIENIDQQRIFYLHGALHIFDAGDELQKYTWINTGIRLIQQIHDALSKDKYPLIVSEGTSSRKHARIRHSDYLSRSLRSISRIRGALFIYGHSLSEQDEHILNVISKNSRLKYIFISIYGDASSKSNKSIIDRANMLSISSRKSFAHEVLFYDASSASVWG